jgi:radical SAM protein (TIGR01212 family)
MNSAFSPRLEDSTWQQAGLRYFSYNHALRQRFGERIQKVSIDAGFTCPNVDGTVAVGGCNFCDNRSFSPSRRLPRQGIRAQIDEGIRRLRLRYTCRRFMAYFQPATNTYAPVERLQQVYGEALSHPDIVGLAIGTRPDCLPDDVLDLITAIAQETYLSVEFGVQSIHERSLTWMNRGHGYREVPEVIERCRGRGFEICGHVILGLPNESPEEMRATAREMARLQLDSIKIHNLYVVKGTPLADLYARGEISLLNLDEYIQILVDFLELLPATMVVERISGDAPDDYFVGPTWSLDKVTILRELSRELQRRDSWQGKQYRP